MNIKFYQYDLNLSESTIRGGVARPDLRCFSDPYSNHFNKEKVQ